MKTHLIRSLANVTGDAGSQDAEQFARSHTVGVGITVAAVDITVVVLMSTAGGGDAFIGVAVSAGIRSTVAALTAAVWIEVIQRLCRDWPSGLPKERAAMVK